MQVTEPAEGAASPCGGVVHVSWAAAPFWAPLTLRAASRCPCWGIG